MSHEGSRYGAQVYNAVGARQKKKRENRIKGQKARPRSNPGSTLQKPLCGGFGFLPLSTPGGLTVAGLVLELLG